MSWKKTVPWIGCALSTHIRKIKNCHISSVMTRWCSGYHGRLVLQGDTGSNPAWNTNFSFISGTCVERYWQVIYIFLSLFLRLLWLQSFIFCLLPWFVGEQPWYTQMSTKKDPCIGCVLSTQISSVVTRWCSGYHARLVLAGDAVRILLRTQIFLSLQRCVSKATVSYLHLSLFLKLSWLESFILSCQCLFLDKLFIM